ncbi:MAG: tetratricopeptide repeat protein [Candidatus Polarisedimenticolia bacterium]
MDDSRIKSLLDEASERYNDGAYGEAITLWEQVQQLDPANQRAREGIRMARLLVSGESSSATSDPRVAAAVARVHELLEMGQSAEALEGVALIRQITPHLPELDALEQQARGHAPDAAAALNETVAMPVFNVESLLEQARSALAEGREDDAAHAASQVLEIEPGNMEACGILSLTSKDGSVGQPPVDLSFEEPRPPVQNAPPRRANEARAEAGSRLAAILAEGQVAFDQGRMQDAIATWSRVFAMDPSNAEAGKRIDNAKAVIDEQARETDDLFYRAVDAQDAGRLEEALGLFQQVVQINPTHLDARNSVEELTARIEGGGTTIAIDQTAAREIEEEKKANSVHEMHLPSNESVPLAIPRELRRPERHAGSAPRVAMNAPAPPRRGLALFGSLVVFAVVGVGAWLWLGESGGSMPEARATLKAPVRPPAPPPPPVDEPNDAAPLQVVAGSSPAPVAEAVPVVTPAPPAGDMTQLLAQARQAARDGRWAEAVLAYREAARLNPADFGAQDELDRAMSHLEKEAKFEQEMGQAVASFNESDFGPCLHKLYRLQQDYPNVRYIEDYIRNSWYNWGVLLLQSGDVDEAAEKFGEVLALDPGDVSSKRARDVARRYHGRPRDSVLESFATSLQPRTIDAR